MSKTSIIEIIIIVIAVVISAAVIPYLKKITANTKLREILTMVEIAVSAAEQIIVGSCRGNEKKKYVLNWLEDCGIIVDGNKLDAMIESAVCNLINKNK